MAHRTVDVGDERARRAPWSTDMLVLKQVSNNAILATLIVIVVDTREQLIGQAAAWAGILQKVKPPQAIYGLSSRAGHRRRARLVLDRAGDDSRGQRAGGGWRRKQIQFDAAPRSVWISVVGSDDDCNLIVAPGVGLGERPTFDGSVGSGSASIPETDQA